MFDFVRPYPGNSGALDLDCLLNEGIQCCSSLLYYTVSQCSQSVQDGGRAQSPPKPHSWYPVVVSNVVTSPAHGGK